MTLMICLDSRAGLSFCGRRLSRDRAVSKRIAELSSGGRLYISRYSLPLFERQPQNAVLCVDPARECEGGGFCFIENTALPDLNLVERIIVFRWNRAYPFDKTFDLSGFRLISSADFSGFSHERITEEVYEK